jgi:hypothetical protein
MAKSTARPVAPASRSPAKKSLTKKAGRKKPDEKSLAKKAWRKKPGEKSRRGLTAPVHGLRSPSGHSWPRRQEPFFHG